MRAIVYLPIVLVRKGRPTSVCTRQPTARFFKGYAPTKMPLVEGSLARPVAGETRPLGR